MIVPEKTCFEAKRLIEYENLRLTRREIWVIHAIKGREDMRGTDPHCYSIFVQYRGIGADFAVPSKLIKPKSQHGYRTVGRHALLSTDGGRATRHAGLQS
jgi:hypothetical protein